MQINDRKYKSPTTTEYVFDHDGKNELVKIEERYSLDGNTKIVTNRGDNGKLHSPNGEPSVRKIKNGVILFEQWHYHGVLHRDNDQPAEIKYDKATSNIVYKTWYQNGKRYRDYFRPHTICYTNEITYIICKEWYDYDQPYELPVYHPVKITRNSVGNIVTKRYKSNNLDMPTRIDYNFEGTFKVMEEWRNSVGKLHRPLNKGPAKIYYNRDLIVASAFYLEGRKIQGNIY